MKIPSIIAAVVAVLCCTSSITPGQTPPAPTSPPARVSPHDLASAVIDGNRVMIIYGRPFTRAPGTGEIRKIWGGLVPWGQLWRLGANEATLMITQQPIVVGNVEVPAGAYSLAMIPQENGPSKLIINKQIGQAGGEHDEKLDVGRADMARTAIDETVNQLTIAITPREGGGGTIAVRWENTQFTVPLTVKK